MAMTFAVLEPRRTNSELSWLNPSPVSLLDGLARPLRANLGAGPAPAPAPATRAVGEARAVGAVGAPPDKLSLPQLELNRGPLPLLVA